MKVLRTLAVVIFGMAILLATHYSGADTTVATENDPQVNRLAGANCGVQTLAWLMKNEGDVAAAWQVASLLPASENGFSIKELSGIAASHGHHLSAYRIVPAELNEITLPVIIHLSNDREGGKTGHYTILEKIDDAVLTIYDPQSGNRYQKIFKELSNRWRGIILSLTPEEGLQGKAISEKNTRQITGASHLVATVPNGEGSNGKPNGNEGECNGPYCDQCPNGRPTWSVNMINFNVYLHDIPLWYDPAIGPSVGLSLSYNSQASVAGNEPFGNKWQFNYGSYLKVEESSGSVTVVMSDGRRDIYTPDGSGGYVKPYEVYNTLVKIADNHFELRTPYGWVYVYRLLSDAGYLITGTLNIPSVGATTPCLIEIRDPHGQRLTFDYNSNGELVTITDALGQDTTITYTDGKVTRVTDPFGRFADFQYENNNLTRITDMGGYWTSISYDENSYITGLENSRGKTEFMIEPAGGTATAPYPPPGAVMGASHRITVKDPLGGKSEYFYNGLVGYGWYVSPRDYVEYEDASTNNAAATVPKTVYYYDNTSKGAREEIKSITYPEGRYVSYTYDYDTGQRLSESDSYGNITTYTYNEMGLISSVTPPMGIGKTFVYDENNHVDLKEITTAGLGTVQIGYNEFHQVNHIEDIAGKVTDITYNSFGQLETVTHHLEDHTVLTEYVYYESGTASQHRLKQVQIAGQVVAEYTYDNMGRIQTYTDAAGVTLTYDYDNLNHITRVTYPDTRSAEYSYSGCCPRLIDSMTDRAGRTTFYDYDELERLIGIINPEGGQTRYEYDANSNRVKLIDPNNNVTSFEYNLENRLTRKTYADGKSVSYAYNKNGLVSRRIDAREIRTSYIYDANRNLLQVIYSDGTPAVKYTYDNYDRLVSMQDGTDTTSYTYYADSSLHTVDGPWENDTLTYIYDKMGRMTSVTPQAGQSITYVHDDLSRLTDIQSGAGTFTYGYTTAASPLVQSLTRPNTSVTTYTYNDPLKRLTELTNRNGASELISQYAYTYDDPDHPDQRSSETVTHGEPITISEDELITYDHNKLNQLIKSSPPDKVFFYDDSGNMTRGFTPEGYAFDAKYDAENRLTSIEYLDNGGIRHRTEYTYKGDGLLAQIKKYENDILQSDVRIVRNGFFVLQERNANNEIEREYTWDPNAPGGIGGLLNLRVGGTDISYLYDGKRNVTALQDAAQNVVATYRYDEFGNLKAKTDTLSQAFMFSTKRYDIQTGLSYFGYRFYSPAIGKWITRDPIEETGGINLYAYASNDPVNLIDPLGLAGFGIEGGGGIGLGDYKSPGATSDTAGSGIYIGAKPDAHAELGAYTYQQKSQIGGGKLGLGLSLVIYWSDAEEFFKGVTCTNTLTFGPVSLTYHYNSRGEEIGRTFSIFGKGGGLSYEKGISRGTIHPLQ